jgi:hypothetical protein
LKTKKHEFQFWISWNHFSVWLFFFYICTERRKVSVFCFCFLLFPSFVLSSSRSSRLLLRPSTYSSLRSSTLVFFSLFFFCSTLSLNSHFSFSAAATQLGCLNRTFIVSMVCLFSCSFVFPTSEPFLPFWQIFVCLSASKSHYGVSRIVLFFTLNRKNTLNLWQAFRKKEITNRRKTRWSIKPPWQ